ncbi:daptide-type RiPP biosynthesis dehydogenase [Streptomyces sp. URMC 123]|uniref:daptide-type RiPP biosynthesis dehydogenase n=1 Tax=Streptomyces sp. URMC 123 TaxID=3423403 RepID=UPI003F1ADD54
MTSPWQLTAPLTALVQATAWARETGSSHVVLVVDPAVADQDITAQVHSALTAAGAQVRTVTAEQADILSIHRLADCIPYGAVTAVVGGGTAMDLAKLASLVARHPDAAKWLEVKQRGGLIALPPALGQYLPMLAVPTTLGTGSERGPVACYTLDGFKRLATGSVLQPAASLYLPDATRLLPAHLVSEGVLEALHRTIAPYIGDPIPQPDADPLCERLASALVTAGYQIAHEIRHGRTVPDQLRLRLARLSPESHTARIHGHRSPYGSRAWPIANELSTHLGIGKMRALPPVWAGVWARILAGDARFGSADRLHGMWSVIRAAAPHLADNPLRGLTQLMADWHISLHVSTSAHDNDCVARRCLRAWGADLPHLGRLSLADIRLLLDEFLDPRLATANGWPVERPRHSAERR